MAQKMELLTECSMKMTRKKAYRKISTKKTVSYVMYKCVLTYFHSLYYFCTKVSRNRRNFVSRRNSFFDSICLKILQSTSFTSKCFLSLKSLDNSNWVLNTSKSINCHQIMSTDVFTFGVRWLENTCVNQFSVIISVWEMQALEKNLWTKEKFFSSEAWLMY